jgi:hypothetical protein
MRLETCRGCAPAGAAGANDQTPSLHAACAASLRPQQPCAGLRSPLVVSSSLLCVCASCLCVVCCVLSLSPLLLLLLLALRPLCGGAEPIRAQQDDGYTRLRDAAGTQVGQRGQTTQHSGCAEGRGEQQRTGRREGNESQAARSAIFKPAELTGRCMAKQTCSAEYLLCGHLCCCCKSPGQGLREPLKLWRRLCVCLGRPHRHRRSRNVERRVCCATQAARRFLLS